MSRRGRHRTPCGRCLGEPAARELLDAITRSDSDRAVLIGRLFARADGEWLAELLMDLEGEEGERARLQLIDALQRVLDLTNAKSSAGAMWPVQHRPADEDGHRSTGRQEQSGCRTQFDVGYSRDHPAKSQQDHSDG